MGGGYPRGRALVRLLLLIAFAHALVGPPTLSAQDASPGVSPEAQGPPDAPAAGMGDLPPRTRLEADPRAAGPPLPESVEEVAARFLPTWSPIGERRTFSLERRANRGFDQSVLAGACYAVVAWSETVRQLDADVFQGGERIGQDTRRDPWPVATFCARRTGNVRIELHAVRGEGEVQALVVVDRQRLARVRGDRDPISNRLSALQARTAPEALPAAAPLHLDLPGPSMRRVSLESLGEGCFLAVALAESDAVQLALRVVGEGAVVLAEDRSRSPEGALWWCQDATTLPSLELVTAAGRGQLVLQVLRRATDAETR